MKLKIKNLTLGHRKSIGLAMSKTLIFIFLLSAFLFPLSSSSQVTPEFLVTWRANSYVPSVYQGKVLPSRGTPVGISFELIDKDKLADLSKNEIRWYLDDKLQKSGRGIKAFDFSVSKFANQSHQIRIVAVKYKNLGNVEKTIDIPIVGSKVVIDSPYPNNRMKAGKNDFRALLYFFNIKNLEDLSIEWTANGKKTSEIVGNPELLTLDATGGQRDAEINLSVNAKNRANEIESANQSIRLSIK